MLRFQGGCMYRRTCAYTYKRICCVYIVYTVRIHIHVYAGFRICLCARFRIPIFGRFRRHPYTYTNTISTYGICIGDRPPPFCET